MSGRTRGMTGSALDFAADALACHRLAKLVVSDVIFDGPRAKIMESAHVAGFDRFNEGIRCLGCVSVWSAFGIAIARAVAPDAWRPIGRALALSDVAVIIGAFVV